MKKIQKKKVGLGKSLKGLGVGALYNVADKEELNKTDDKQQQDLTTSNASIKIKFIEPNPYQPRKEFEETALQELADSIKIHGVVQPITVRKLNNKAYQIISGERRFRASQLAGLDEIPAYVREANDQEMREIALIENIQRRDLNPMEISISYQALIEDIGLTHEELSVRLGKSRATITNFLRLLKLPPDVQDGLKTGKLRMGHARALLGVANVDMQLEVYRQIKEHGLSVRQVEKMVNALGKKKQNKQAALNDKKAFAYQQIEKDLCNFFEAKVTLKINASGGGEIVVPYLDEGDLNRIIELVK